jgi:hypothetical protein
VEVCDDACKGVSDGSAAGFHEPVITDFGLAVSFDMHATQATTRIMLSSVQVHVSAHRELKPLQRSGHPPLPPQHGSRDITYLG